MIDVTSAEGLSNVTTLINSSSKIAYARSLQGEKAQKLIDLLDQVSDSDAYLSILRVTMRHSFSRYRTSMRDYLGGPRNYFTRSAKLAGCCPPHMSFDQSSPVLVNLDGMAALRTSAKENIEDILWPLST